MCKQVPSVTLQTAVLTTVKGFARDNTPFSVHDITTAIRSKTAQGELEIPEVEISGASFRFDVQHSKVKSLFDELWRTGVFDPDFTLNRQFNGMYFLYTPAAGNGGAYVGGVSVSPQAALSAGVPAAQAPVATAPAAATSPVSGAISPDVAVRVTKYLAGCVLRSFRPSLKQVQSAIKRGECSTGYGCDVLKTFIVALGYTVVDDPDSASKAQVVTV